MFYSGHYFNLYGKYDRNPKQTKGNKMKKMLLIPIALIVGTTAYAQVEQNEPARDSYIGMRLHKNANMAIDMSTNVGVYGKLQAKPWGISINAGQRVNQYITLEGEIGYGGGIRAEGFGETDTFSASAAMFNAYLHHEISEGISPYVGLGLGMGLVTGELDLYGYGIYLSDTAISISYQLMLGVNFDVSDRFLVNVGVRYRDYGQLEMGYGTTKFLFDVDATEFNVGVAYKF